MVSHPVLYSYRRCPYAMRARMAIYLSGLAVEQREIEFWDKPALMLEASPKGTVPILILLDGQVLDESLDIMFWALEQPAILKKELMAASLNSVEFDPSNLIPNDTALREQMMRWIEWNDGEFKGWLDKYKYAERFPEHPQHVYRAQGAQFLNALEHTLNATPYLLGPSVTLADLAVMPFVRQFVNVDKAQFSETSYPNLSVWLNTLLNSQVFQAIMKKKPKWSAGQPPLWVDDTGRQLGF